MITIRIRRQSKFVICIIYISMKFLYYPATTYDIWDFIATQSLNVIRCNLRTVSEAINFNMHVAVQTRTRCERVHTGIYAFALISLVWTLSHWSFWCERVLV